MVSLLRATEFIHYITRKDIHLGKNIKSEEYTHFTVKMIHKRLRYNYQIQRRKNERSI
jgi:hypothetical protein